jgi:hypothetical protein
MIINLDDTEDEKQPEYYIQGIEPKRGEISKLHVVTMYVKIKKKNNFDFQSMKQQFQFLVRDENGEQEFSRRIPITFLVVDPQHPEFSGGTLLLGTHKFPSYSQEKKVLVSLIDEKENEILPRAEFQYFDPNDMIKMYLDDYYTGYSEHLSMLAEDLAEDGYFK